MRCFPNAIHFNTLQFCTSNSLWDLIFLLCLSCLHFLTQGLTLLLCLFFCVSFFFCIIAFKCVPCSKVASFLSSCVAVAWCLWCPAIRQAYPWLSLSPQVVLYLVPQPSFFLWQLATSWQSSVRCKSISDYLMPGNPYGLPLTLSQSSSSSLPSVTVSVIFVTTTWNKLAKFRQMLLHFWPFGLGIIEDILPNWIPVRETISNWQCCFPQMSVYENSKDNM